MVQFDVVILQKNGWWDMGMIERIVEKIVGPSNVLNEGIFGYKKSLLEMIIVM